MSVKIIQRVWEFSKAKGVDRLILIAIADNANDAGWAYPGLKNLCEKTLVSRPTMQKHLDDLVTLGELYIHAVNGRGHHYGVLAGMETEQKNELIASIEKRRGKPSDYRPGKTYLRVKPGLPDWTRRVVGSEQDGLSRSVSNPSGNHNSAPLLERHFGLTFSKTALEVWDSLYERAGAEVFEAALIATVKAGGGRKMRIDYVKAIVDRMLAEKKPALSFNERAALEDLGVTV